VTAVQVKTVNEPSEWQKKYTRFSKAQLAFSEQAQQGGK
jgi:hypothetical protein